MERKLLLIGGGGHCHSVIDSLLSLGCYDQIGILDRTECSCSGVPYLGTDESMRALFEDGWTEAFISVGSVGDTALRRSLREKARSIGFSFPSLIDPSAVVSERAEIGEGVFIGKRAVINIGSVVQSFAIINSGAILEHDCRIGSFSHISPGAVLCGQVRVGNDSHVGAGSVVRQQIVIGDRCLVGAGSVVVSDLPSGVKAFGNPCRVVKA